MTIEKIIEQIQKDSSWLAYRRAASQIVKICEANPDKAAVNIKTAFLSSFTVEPLVDFTIVQAARSSIGLNPYIALYGQVSQEILNSNSGLYSSQPDITVIIAEPDKLTAEPFQATQELINLAGVFKKNCDGLLVICTFIAEPQWPMHVVVSDKTKAIQRTNDLLQKAFADDSQVQICDMDSIAAYYGYSRALSAQMLHMARIPFSEGFMAMLAKKIVSHFIAYKGLTMKCLVLDCDNTLWGGIVGEDGIDGIKLGPDTPGREYVDFQKVILDLYDQGVILAVNSKNNYDDVMQVIHEHPHMVLREEHFAGIAINWNDKPSNMRKLAEQINVGMDTFVFVDDNPAERELMRLMLPEVRTISLPANPSLYARTLRETNLFAKATLTQEDKARGRIYAQQRRRTQLRKSVTSLEDFLRSLDMVISIRPAGPEDYKRISQLTQRTNQFNLTTRRYTEADIQRIDEDKDSRIYVVGLKDKFGDNGTVATAIVNCKNGIFTIDTFLFSCRVIGRGAEDAFVDRILKDAALARAETIRAEYIKTKKNALTADFWDRMGFKTLVIEQDKTLYSFDIKDYKPKTFEYLTFE